MRQSAVYICAVQQGVARQTPTPLVIGLRLPLASAATRGTAVVCCLAQASSQRRPQALPHLLPSSTLCARCAAVLACLGQHMGRHPTNACDDSDLVGLAFARNDVVYCGFGAHMVAAGTTRRVGGGRAATTQSSTFPMETPVKTPQTHRGPHGGFTDSPKLATASAVPAAALRSSSNISMLEGAGLAGYVRAWLLATYGRRAASQEGSGALGTRCRMGR